MQEKTGLKLLLLHCTSETPQTQKVISILLSLITLSIYDVLQFMITHIYLIKHVAHSTWVAFGEIHYYVLNCYCLVIKMIFFPLYYFLYSITISITINILMANYLHCWITFKLKTAPFFQGTDLKKTHANWSEVKLKLSTRLVLSESVLVDEYSDKWSNALHKIKRMRRGRVGVRWGRLPELQLIPNTTGKAGVLCKQVLGMVRFSCIFGHGHILMRGGMINILAFHIPKRAIRRAILIFSSENRPTSALVT